MKITSKKTNLLKSLLWLLIFLLFPAAMIHAQEQEKDLPDADTPSEIQLEEVLIEGSLIEDTVRNTPKNVTVITATDIKQAPGKELIDVLSSQAGLNVMSYSGNGKQSTIDLRGMGATANSNVLVIVDGIRLNAPDLSGADLSSIDLDTVEKIEIIRGSESVIYGDGAVAGVIKIYTKKTSRKPALKVQGGIGSYGAKDASIHYSASVDPVSWSANASYHDSDGYRENGFFRKNSGGINLTYRFDEALSLVLLSSTVADEYGLPGPVSIDDIDSEERRIQSNNPDDSGKTTDQRLAGGFDWNLNSGGTIHFRRGYRFRNNQYLLGYNPSSSVSREDQTAHIDEATKTLTISFSQPYSIDALQHRFKCGIDQSTSYYVRDSKPQNERHNSNTESLGAFLVNQWLFSKSLWMNLGYRNNRFRGKFRKDTGRFSGSTYLWQNGDLIDKTWDNQSHSLGLLFKQSRETNLFFNLATSFRTPNVDEFAAADSDLKPQQGQNVELGIRHDDPGIFSYALSVFQMTTKDEIYYGMDASTGETENRNYDDITIRRGVEAELKYFPLDNLTLWGNVTYLSARFEGSGKTVPLVPAFKANFGSDIFIADDVTLGLDGTVVSDQYDGNDESNDRFEKLDAYSVFNGKLTYDVSMGKSLQLGIRNIFNQLYSTIAYSESYYPMPTRNIYGKLNWRF